MKKSWVVAAACLLALGCSGSDSNKDAGTQAPVDAGTPVDAGVPDAGDVGSASMSGAWPKSLRSVVVEFVGFPDGGLNRGALTLIGSNDVDYDVLCKNSLDTVTQATYFVLDVISPDGADLAAGVSYPIDGSGSSVLVRSFKLDGSLKWSLEAVDGGVDLSKLAWPTQLVGDVWTGGSADVSFSAYLEDTFNNLGPIAGSFHGAGCPPFRL